jgi:crotonobetainyl-CoA:carnitine CoA-transferase CaiB-like acyl-CoA transferase
MGGTVDPLPLDGIRVLDLTRARAGPTAVRQLADWGADCVMIEPPVALDISDTMSGPRHGPDYQNLHRNKRSMTLNLKTPEGIEILRRMVAEADVLVENYRPDVKHRLRIDYESLAAVNPRLIYASISGFGQSGPYRDRPGFDQIAQGMGGLMSITGLPGQGPVRVGIPIDDLSAGLFTAIGILLALIERQRSGRGQWVHSSLLQAQIAMLDYQAARWLISGEVPGQAGNNHPMAITTGLFQTADEPINVCADPQPIWERFCRAVEGEDLRADPRFASDELRMRNGAAVVEAMTAKLKQRKGREWIEILNRAGVPSGPVNRIDQVFADPQVQHLGMARPVTHPTLGEIDLVGQPVILARTPSRMSQAAPEPGEATEEMLRGLGFGAEEIEALRRKLVV